MGSYIDNPFVCCSCFYPWGTIIMQQMNIGQAVNFTPSKNIAQANEEHQACLNVFQSERRVYSSLTQI